MRKPQTPPSATAGPSREAWLKALQDIQRAPLLANDPAAVTAMEFGHMLGISPGHASKRLRELVHAGKAERTSKWIMRDGNSPTKIPAYRLKP